MTTMVMVTTTTTTTNTSVVVVYYIYLFTQLRQPTDICWIKRTCRHTVINISISIYLVQTCKNIECKLK